MKKGRHTKILELIQAKEICTQDELLSELKDCGFNVTQATVSRDIKELKLTKTLSKNGKNCYTSKSFDLSERAAGMSALFSTSVISVEYAGNLVIVKTVAGMAQAVCTAIDAAQISDILGSVAGDDTIFLAGKTPEKAVGIASKLKLISIYEK